MIGPVSETGRTMMASLQQAMQKGMPPDQAIQYVKSMATQGVAPLADLYSMMNQFQRLKQQQAQAPQTPPTIRDQLNMAAQQQQMQPQGNIQQMQAPAPAGQPMDRGLGAIDAGRMEYPQFAGGGMVALAGGGDVVAFQNEGLVPPPNAQNPDDIDIVTFVRKRMPNFDMLTPEQKQQVLRSFEPMYMEARQKIQGTQPTNMREMARSVAAVNPFDSPDQQLGSVFEQLAIRPAESAPAPVADERRPAAPRREVVAAPKKDRYEEFRYEKPDLEAIRKEREERQKTQKTGAYSQADADLAAYIEEQKKQGGDTKEAYRNFWVMTGASLMANKSPNFLQALGESVKENYGGLVKDLKQLKDENKALRLEEIRLRQARERALETGDAADQSRYDALQQRYENRQYDIFKTELGIQEKALDRAHNERLTALRATGNEKQADRLIKLWQAANAETDPYKKQQMLNAYQAELDVTRDITEATTATGVGAQIRAETAADTRVANLAKDNPLYRRALRDSQNEDLSEDDRRKALEVMRTIEQQTRGMMGAGPRADRGLTGGAYTGPYAGFSAEPIG